MSIKTFTRILSLGFILVGILGFIPAVMYAPYVGDPALMFSAYYGRLFGLFPINALHNIVHLSLGVWGLLAARQIMEARRYCKFTSVLYGVLTLFGLVPGLNVFFGLVPLF